MSPQVDVDVSQMNFSKAAASTRSGRKAQRGSAWRSMCLKQNSGDSFRGVAAATVFGVLVGGPPAWCVFGVEEGRLGCLAFALLPRFPTAVSAGRPVPS